MITIHYEESKKITAEILADVFSKSGIRRPVEDLPRLQKMIDHADIIITAWDGETLVGIARAITDFSYCCYLSDLAVDRDYQNQGIGKELVRRIHERLGEEISLILLASPIAMDYYPKIGFHKIQNGYIIPRK
ncbi:GNAT family N-acetyltransferase [Robertmurraya korlensis]|uniref:GNAT family N-acetyltransferase n=1 Tax=Robertmurraya korlensis TaxID=519977 RepID=UPI00204019E9|nr:GNAT family N-acetyltransferase [Robertmurraya korlensis]MCM3600796.1 GNAT family N-acetyltransferase [Robertmurraya korlensis]